MLAGQCGVFGQGRRRRGHILTQYIILGFGCAPSEKLFQNVGHHHPREPFRLN
jgi:hypothetical protein